MTLQDIIERFIGYEDRRLLHEVLLELHFLKEQNKKIMGLTEDLSAQLDRIEAAQADAKTQNDTIGTEIKTLISEIGTTPGISAEDAAKLVARATGIADASEALDTALKGSAAAGANTPPVDPAV